MKNNKILRKLKEETTRKWRKRSEELNKKKNSAATVCSVLEQNLHIFLTFSPLSLGGLALN